MVNVHKSDYEQYNEYSFHFGLLFFRFLRIEQTDLDQFVGHVEERLAFLQGAFWKQQTFQHGAVRARISREQNAFARCGCVQAAPSFGSRLFLGYPNRMLVLNAIAASRIEMVTASIRRISLAGEDESLVDVIPKHIRFLPNTAGCQTANDCFDSPETGMARLL